MADLTLPGEINLSKETKRAYQRTLDKFNAWSRNRNTEPSESVDEDLHQYMKQVFGLYSVSYAAQVLSALRASGLLDHTQCADLWRELAERAKEDAGNTKKAAPLSIADIAKIVGKCGHDLTGKRDKALVLIGFSGALRRSELIGIHREHLHFDSSGLRLFIPRSKEDQQGNGATLRIPFGRNSLTCPVRALKDWLEASSCQNGPVFRKIDRWGNIWPRGLGGDAIRDLLQKLVHRGGIQGWNGLSISGHSLRAGFITEADKAGVTDSEIMAHSRHANIESVRHYVRRKESPEESPAGRIGL